MKKVLCVLLLSLSLLFVSCGEKNLPAEITIIGNDNTEQTHLIQTTDDPVQVKEALQLLNQVVPESNFSGVSMQLEARIDGTLTVTDQEVRTIDLGYDLNLDAQMNLRDYRMNGKFELNGSTKTDSNSLTLDSKQNLKVDFINDDSFLYCDIAANLDVLRGTLKAKEDITEFTNSYKAIIVSFLDLYKYYKLGAIISDVDSFVEDYKVSISKTTKDSFTLDIHIPSSLIDQNLNMQEDLVIQIEISCKKVLPVAITFNADEFIQELLEKEYVEKYISSEVDVKSANLRFNIKLDYGKYTIKELTEEEKEVYVEYSLGGII